MMILSPLATILRKHQHEFYQVVEFDEKRERILSLDLTASNPFLTPSLLNNTAAFTDYIQSVIKAAQCRFAIGGYGELRDLYARSELFGIQQPLDATGSMPEPRRLHLGVDIWGAAGTAVHAFMGGMIHSYAFNDSFGDYGATMILEHQLEGMPFYSLYGHIQLDDITGISKGQYVNRGQLIAHFGELHENGHWPPHLHFQVIADLEGRHGDYPGVCKASEHEKYLLNCPDPDLVLQMNRYL
jgi:murein DD-endopeptidase MepM/ murein hydrolase activator NlpD